MAHGPLNADEIAALRTAATATYAPGIVAAQTVFHGKDNGGGIETNRLLRGLAQRGYLRTIGRRGPYPGDVGWADGAVSIEYEITQKGRNALEASSPAPDAGETP